MAFRIMENQQDRHEFPAGVPTDTGQDDDSVRRTTHFLSADAPSMWQAHRAPANQYEALMEAAPGEDPVDDETTLETGWEQFRVKLDQAGLTDRERIVVDCIVFGGRSLSQTANILAVAMGRNKAFSPPTIRRIRISAFDKLRAHLGEYA